jgi:hypothetical protein
MQQEYKHSIDKQWEKEEKIILVKHYGPSRLQPYYLNYRFKSKIHDLVLLKQDILLVLSFK